MSDKLERSYKTAEEFLDATRKEIARLSGLPLLTEDERDQLAYSRLMLSFIDGYDEWARRYLLEQTDVPVINLASILSAVLVEVLCAASEEFSLEGERERCALWMIGRITSCVMERVRGEEAMAQDAEKRKHMH